MAVSSLLGSSLAWEIILIFVLSKVLLHYITELLLLFLWKRSNTYDYNFQSVNNYLVVIHGRNSFVPIALVSRGPKITVTKNKITTSGKKKTQNCEVSHLSFWLFAWFFQKPILTIAA